MGEFLRGWRRKAGCITLLVACVATIGLVRSFLVRDELRLPIRGDLHLISVDRGSIDWTTVHDYRQYLAGEDLRSSWIARPLEPPDEDTGPDWHWNGFKFGPVGWAVPLWSIILPLSLLSACLILWKRGTAGIHNQYQCDEKPRQALNDGAS